MKTVSSIFGATVFYALFGIAAPSAVFAADAADGIVAVSGRVSKDYVRKQLPDGTFQPEEYAFGDGGFYGGPFRDPSIDKLSFLEIARVIAGPLKAQHYIPAKSLDSEKLMIMVHWGTTITPDTFSMTEGAHLQQDANDLALSGQPQATAASVLAQKFLSLDSLERDQLDYKNALMLGYDSEGLIGTTYGAWVGHIGQTGIHRDDLIAEIEDNQYFVVLIAYDFQLYRRQKKLKALWETRFSINESHNDFDRVLPVMAQFASQYFGQKSPGLLRSRASRAFVEIGPLKNLGEVKDEGAVPTK